jgi:two-component system NtrC family response regulator
MRLYKADAVCKQNCEKYGFDLKTFSTEAISELLDYNWPGNIRELISVVERSVILSETQEIQKDELFLDTRK